MLAAKGSTCLVTGGAGFIGSHLTERLVALGHRVRVVDNLSTGDVTNLAGVVMDAITYDGFGKVVSETGPSCQLAPQTLPVSCTSK